MASGSELIRSCVKSQEQDGLIQKKENIDPLQDETVTGKNSCTSDVSESARKDHEKTGASVKKRFTWKGLQFSSSNDKTSSKTRIKSDEIEVEAMSGKKSGFSFRKSKTRASLDYGVSNDSVNNADHHHPSSPKKIHKDLKETSLIAGSKSEACESESNASFRLKGIDLSKNNEKTAPKNAVIVGGEVESNMKSPTDSNKKSSHVKECMAMLQKEESVGRSAFSKFRALERRMNNVFKSNVGSSTVKSPGVFVRSGTELSVHVEKCRPVGNDNKHEKDETDSVNNLCSDKEPLKTKTPSRKLSKVGSALSMKDETVIEPASVEKTDRNRDGWFRCSERFLQPTKATRERQT